MDDNPVMSKYLLAGDIGGTKTLLAIFSQEGGAKAPLVEAAYPSEDHAGLAAIIEDFLGANDFQVEAASFGVAGPVIENRVEVTNLPWVIDGEELKVQFAFSQVYLLNDLQSIAQAIPTLTGEDLETLHPGIPSERGAIAVVAPGTGLGEGYLTWCGDGYLAHPSEGGHTDFAPTNELQMELLTYLLQSYEHVSYERVSSGMGLPDIYAFLKGSGRGEEPDWLTEKLATAEGPTPVIVSAALDDQNPSPLCQAALDLFVAVLGAEAGNLALKVLATGGVYLGGGIPPRILPLLKSETFRRNFLAKGRQSDLVSRMPVHVILNPKAALIGAADYGLRAL